MTFYYINWTGDPFATKPGLTAHHHKVDCLVKKIGLLCSGQGQGHRKGSEFQWMFIRTISPQLLNLLWPNLLWWCNIIGQSVMQEDWFAVFKVRVTVKADIIRYDCFYHIYWTDDFFLTIFNWIVHHHKLECFFLCKNQIVVFKVQVTVLVQKLIESLCNPLC